MTENQIVVYRPLTPDVWRMITEVAPAMAASRLFGVNAEQALAVMLKGYELGFSLTGAFEFIHVIQNRPALSPRGHLALILQSPEFAGFKVEDKPDSCRVWMKRRNGVEYTAEYSMQDATVAGLVKSDGGWTKYPANMLRWRAVGYCADVVFPDIAGGMKRADELGAIISPDGDVIEDFNPSTSYQPPVTIEQPTPTRPVTPPVQAPLPDPPQPKYPGVYKTTDIFKLLKEAGHKSPSSLITQANSGNLPSNQQEVDNVMTGLVLAGYITIEAIDPSLAPAPPAPNPLAQDSAAPQTLAELIELVSDPLIIAQHNGGNYPEDTPGEVATMYAKLVDEKVLPATAESVF